MSEVDLSKAFMVGSDSTTEWMLPWFFENYKKYNDIHLTVVDFGMSDDMLYWIEKNIGSIGDMRVDTNGQPKWFLKPLAMLNTPFKQTCWLDLDIEIIGNISEIFNYIVPSKLTMAMDRPWSKKFNTTMYNSGVVAFEGKPEILKKWWERIQQKPSRGDQETLHNMLDPLSQLMYINELPHKYNVLRLDHLNKNIPKDILMNHWTGQKGKDHIRSLMNE
jgi:hypothetical protein